MNRKPSLLGRYLKPQAPRVTLLSVLLLAGIALQLANPQVIRYFLDTARSGGSDRALLLAAGAFLLFALLQQLAGLATTFTSQLVSWTATNLLRRDLTLHCLRLDMPFHKVHTPGEMIDRIDGDATQLANFFSEFVIRLVGSALLAAGILVLLYREDPRVGLGLTAYALLTLLALGAIQRIAVDQWKTARRLGAEMFGYLEERIGGAEEIRAAGAEQHALLRLLQMMRVVMQKYRVGFLLSNVTFNLTNLLFAIGYAIGLAIGVFLYTRGSASLGTAYLVVYYIGMLSEPLQGIRQQVQDFQQASASLQRIQELFDQQPQVTPAALAAQPRLPHGPASLKLEQVSFHYEDNENVLEDVSFELQPGKVLGVLGRTGSGKSTLTRLLFRLYDPADGCIRLDGQDLRDLPLAALRARVGMVTQDVQLFQASIRDNLTFFDRSLADSQIEAALRALGLHDWVQSLPHGLDTPLLAGGQGLSAGEAQLLAFTRVFLKDPGLVLLDEASSRLDPATEARLERAVDRLFQDRTAILIAHRLHTVQRADHILILERGRVVEYGDRLSLASDPGSRFYGLLQTGLEEALA